MRAWASHSFDKICQHFGSETCISNKNPWASHIPISTISIKLCCNCNRISSFSLKILRQMRARPVHSLVKIFQHFGAQTYISVRNPWAKQTPASIFSLKSDCKCNYISRCSSKLLEQMRAWPFHFFDKICPHFGSQTCISGRHSWAKHTFILAISFKILLQLRSHIKIFIETPGANEGLTFPFLRQNLSAFRISNQHFR